MSNVITPSYRSGWYAPGHGTPKYPQLWKGCVGAWAPLLGPNGTTLRDSSGSNNHGTLTNMDAATDWVISGGKYALDFDGTNDFVDIGVNRLPKIEAAKTISLWATYDGTSTRRMLFALALTGQSIDIEISNPASTAGVVAASWGGTAMAFAFINTISADQWFHICYTTPGYNISNAMYLNGVLSTTTSDVSTQSGTPVSCRIGSFNTAFPSPYHNRKIDDIRVYNRRLTNPEIALLARRRGIAYELATKRSVKVPATGGCLVGGKLVNRGLLNNGRLVR